MTRILSITAAVIIGAGLGPFVRAQVCRELADGRRGPPACPRCSSPVGRTHFGALRMAALWTGTCATCSARVGPPRGTVEVVGVAALAVLAATTNDLLLLIAFGWMAALGVTLSVIDIAVHRLPNRLTGALFLGTVSPLAVEAGVSDEWGRLLEAVISSAVAGIFYGLLSAITRGAVGLGDAKLALGLVLAVGWAGWRAAAAAIMLGFVLTGLTALVLLLFTSAGRKDSLPHGPFLVAASIATITLANM